MRSSFQAFNKPPGVPGLVNHTPVSEARQLPEDVARVARCNRCTLGLLTRQCVPTLERVGLT